MKHLALTFIVLSMALIVALPVQAKPGKDGPRHPDPTMVHDKLVELRGRLLREMVGLSESRTLEVEKILKGFDDEHRTYSAMLAVARKTMHRLVEEDSNDDAALARAVEDLRLAHDYLHKVRDRQFQAMQKVLKPKEQAIFFRSLGKLRHEVRRRLRHGRDKP